MRVHKLSEKLSTELNIIEECSIPERFPPPDDQPVVLGPLLPHPFRHLLLAAQDEPGLPQRGLRAHRPVRDARRPDVSVRILLRHSGSHH